MMTKEHIHDYKCPVCGKLFFCYAKEMWTYKAYFGKEIMFCSWGCMRKAEAEHEAKPSKRGRRKRNEGYISKAEE